MAYPLFIPDTAHRSPRILNVSYRRVGGLRFVRIGKLSFSFCISSKPF